MLLEVKNLCVDFKVGKQTLRAVNDVSFSLGERDSLGLVGESGCGKSTTAFALMRLLAKNGIVVLQNHKTEEFEVPEGLEIYRVEKYGDTLVHFLRAAATPKEDAHV